MNVNLIAIAVKHDSEGPQTDLQSSIVVFAVGRQSFARPERKAEVFWMSSRHLYPLYSAMQAQADHNFSMSLHHTSEGDDKLLKLEYTEIRKKLPLGSHNGDSS